MALVYKTEHGTVKVKNEYLNQIISEEYNKFMQEEKAKKVYELEQIKLKKEKEEHISDLYKRRENLAYLKGRLEVLGKWISSY